MLIGRCHSSEKLATLGRGSPEIEISAQARSGRDAQKVKRKRTPEVVIITLTIITLTGWQDQARMWRNRFVAAGNMATFEGAAAVFKQTWRGDCWFNVARTSGIRTEQSCEGET